MNQPLPRIVITPGEPSGVGPDILIELAQTVWPAEIVAVSDATLLQSRAKQLGLPLHLSACDLNAQPESSPAGHLKLIPVALGGEVNPGALNTANAQHVLKCLEIATDLCLENKAQALVTGPVHKSHMNDSGLPFTGHTELLAARCKAKQVVMLFVVDDVRVALATIHMPLAKVPAAITTDHLQNITRLIHNELQHKFQIAAPRILVCGLNPHAGENGHLGREEIEQIEPAIRTLRAEGIDIVGPLPADTIFTAEHLKSADVILAMYHDQALPVIKYMGFDRAVNMTLGLPIIRTSVDHGTALSLAGTGKANPGSLEAAVKLALHLSNGSLLTRE